MSRLTVNHFGPDPQYVGGMGSVLRVLAEHQIGGDDVRLHATWRPNAPVASAALSMRALARVSRMDRGEIVHVHLSEKGSFVREGAILAAARLRGLRTVTTIHGAEFMPFARQYPWLAFGVLGSAHVITCLDRAVADEIKRHVRSARVELMPNPVSMDEDSPYADETEELVLFAGEISRRKGADVLVGAWLQVAAKRPEARCVMVGPSSDVDVPKSERLEARAPLGSDAMRELMRTARVVALPSRAEGMPMILTEAMSAGRPFVSTPVGGIPELARAGGVLVPAGDDGKLADRLVEFLESPDLARSVGERGRAHCAATRSVTVIDGRLRSLYEV